MLNIELIRFEAQDVITASGVVEVDNCTCKTNAIFDHLSCKAEKHTGPYCDAYGCND